MKNITDKAEKYVNPFTDFGFKRIFGEEPNKNLLLDFLNELLRDEQGNITELTYLKNEQIGNTQLDRKAIFDLYCTNERGEKFIVELQKTKQKFFKDRALYYATFPIQEQAKKSSFWDFKLEKVYTIAILDFEFDEDKDFPNKYRYDVKLQDIETNKIFSDKLNFIYLEMPKFNKSLDELQTHFDKWLYVIKNLHKLEGVPQELQEKVFLQVFQTAEIAKFNQQEFLAYEDSLKYFRDLQNSLDTAQEKGFVRGVEQGIQRGIKQGIQKGMEQGIKQGMEQGIQMRNLEIAKQALAEGLDLETVAKLTGVTVEQLKTLQ